MCAIDALGIPAMLRADAVIISSDPLTAEPVSITLRRRQGQLGPARRGGVRRLRARRRRGGASQLLADGDG